MGILPLMCVSNVTKAWSVIVSDAFLKTMAIMPGMAESLVRMYPGGFDVTDASFGRFL